MFGQNKRASEHHSSKQPSIHVDSTVTTTKGTPFTGVVVAERQGAVLIKQHGHPGHTMWVSIHDVRLHHPRTVDS